MHCCAVLSVSAVSGTLTRVHTFGSCGSKRVYMCVCVCCVCVCVYVCILHSLGYVLGLREARRGQTKNHITFCIALQYSTLHYKHYIKLHMQSRARIL